MTSIPRGLNHLKSKASSFFSRSDLFSKSKVFSNSEFFVNEKGADVGGSNKSNTATIIGAVVGAVAGVAIIAALIAFFLIKKRKAIMTNSADTVKETESSVTVDNNLNTVMQDDDPFAGDFNNELEDLK